MLRARLRPIAASPVRPTSAVACLSHGALSSVRSCERRWAAPVRNRVDTVCGPGPRWSMELIEYDAEDADLVEAARLVVNAARAADTPVAAPADPSPMGHGGTSRLGRQPCASLRGCDRRRAGGVGGDRAGGVGQHRLRLAPPLCRPGAPARGARIRDARRRRWTSAAPWGAPRSAAAGGSCRPPARSPHGTASPSPRSRCVGCCSSTTPLHELAEQAAAEAAAACGVTTSCCGSTAPRHRSCCRPWPIWRRRSTTHPSTTSTSRTRCSRSSGSSTTSAPALESGHRLYRLVARHREHR